MGERETLVKTALGAGCSPIALRTDTSPWPPQADWTLYRWGWQFLQ
jgi:hypothetical protein